MKVNRANRIVSFFIIFAGLSVSAAFGADEAAVAPVMDLAKFGAAIGAGLIVMGAASGIGRFAAAAAESTARQPEAAADIRAAVNLPLFLLEGVAIIGLVVCLLIVLL